MAQAPTDGPLSERAVEIALSDILRDFQRLPLSLGGNLLINPKTLKAGLALAYARGVAVGQQRVIDAVDTGLQKAEAQLGKG